MSGLRERRAGARAKPEQVPQVATQTHWSRTRKESRAARGPEEQVKFRGTDHANVGYGGAYHFTLKSDRRSSDLYQATVTSPLAIAAEKDVARKSSNIAVDLSEIKE